MVKQALNCLKRLKTVKITLKGLGWFITTLKDPKRPLKAFEKHKEKGFHLIFSKSFCGYHMCMLLDEQ